MTAWEPIEYLKKSLPVDNLGLDIDSRINIQTEIVNGELAHYLVWSVRVKG